MKNTRIGKMCSEYGRFITFDEFRSLRRRAEGRRALDVINEWDEDAIILLYDWTYIVELSPSESYFLELGRCSWISPNLDELEAKLYLFVCGEFYSSEYAESAKAEALEIHVRYNIPQEDWYW